MLRLHCHMTRESKEVCLTWRSIGAWHQSTARESIRLLSYSSRSTLTTHNDRSKQRCFKSNTSEQSSEEASSWQDTVMWNLWFAYKDVIFSPWNANLTWGTPPKPLGMLFSPVDTPRNVIGLVLSSNRVAFVVKTWQNLSALTYDTHLPHNPNPTHCVV